MSLPRPLLAVALAALAVLLAPTPARAAPDATLVLEDVALRPGVTVDLSVSVYSDAALPSAACVGRDVLAVNGFAHTAATWEPFARALLAREPGSVCRVLALDLPGHGGSGLPTGGLPFAFLTLDDAASALLGALAALPALGYDVDGLVAHSQGGMVVQLAQQRLVSDDSGLRGAHGVKQVVLLAPTPPAGLPWAFVDGGTAGALLGQFYVAADPLLGPHFAIPDALWPYVFFTTPSGALAPLAPSAADVAARGYNAPEPLLSALQLVGAAPFASRPPVDAGVFGPGAGTRLTVVAFEQDALIRPEEAAAIAAHLSGGEGEGARLQVVTGPFAVHDLYVADPDALLAATRFALP